MSYRVSTGQAFDNASAAILRQQADLLKTQQQLSTGRRITTPADDPVGASRALEVSSGKARNDQYLSNQTAARNGLSFAESTLGSVTDELQQIRSLMVAAGDGTYGDAERRSIATELRSRREHLLGLANTRDADGRYIFSGYQENVRPFIETASGVSYQGDTGQRSVQVSSSRQIPVSQNGSAIFMRLATGNGVFATAAAAANTGGGIISLGSVSDASALDGRRYEIVFGGGSPATTYDIVDVANASTVSAGNPYQSGTAITIAGMSAEISGAPESGDRFSLAPSTRTGLFDVLGDAIRTLETPVTSPARRAELAMSIASGLAQTDAGLESVMLARTEAGTGLSELDQLDSAAQSADLRFQQELSDLRDVDLARAISDLMQQQTQMEAAQKAFVRVMGRSLFDLI